MKTVLFPFIPPLPPYKVKNYKVNYRTKCWHPPSLQKKWNILFKHLHVFNLFYYKNTLIEVKVSHIYKNTAKKQRNPSKKGPGLIFDKVQWLSFYPPFFTLMKCYKKVNQVWYPPTQKTVFIIFSAFFLDCFP